LQLSDEWADSQIDVDGTKGCLRAFGLVKQRYTHLKVILSIGGAGKGSDNFKEVARDPALRNTLAASARSLVDAYGLDGIDGKNFLFGLTSLADRRS
jgi:chitinase